MDVSFVIPLFNCLELTQRCLRSLHATLPPQLNYEVILVDDGSTDGTREWLGQLEAPVRVVLNDRNLGYAAANNRGAAFAQAPLLIFSNNDIVFPPRWFAPLVAAYKSLGSRAGIIGNVQLHAESGAVDHAGIYFDDRGKAQHRRRGGRPWPWAWRKVRLAPAVTGACFAVSRELWEKLRGFDAGYINGSEDIDLCLRAAEIGRINAVALRSIVWHQISASPGRKIRDESNSYRFTQRWRHRVALLSERAVGKYFLERQWLGPRDPDEFASAARIVLFLWRLRPKAPPRLRALAEAAVDREIRRWKIMFNQTTVAPVSEIPSHARIPTTI